MKRRSKTDSPDVVAHDAARHAANSLPLRLLARVGFVVLGALHTVLGAIAISVATSSGGGEASQTGALSQISRTPGGVFMLWTIIVGMLALAVMQVVQAVVARGANRKRTWARRANELGKGASYCFIAGLAFVFARGDSTSTTKTTRGVSETLLDTPGGTVPLFVVGLIVFTVGAAFIFRGASRGFTEDVSVPPGTAGRVTVALGVTGFVTKGATLCTVGLLFVVSTFTRDSSIASGLDGALKSLAQLPFGGFLLVGFGVASSSTACTASCGRSSRSSEPRESPFR